VLVDAGVGAHAPASAAASAAPMTAIADVERRAEDLIVMLS
jgi:hypothetical protein